MFTKPLTIYKQFTNAPVLKAVIQAWTVKRSLNLPSVSSNTSAKQEKFEDEKILDEEDTFGTLTPPTKRRPKSNKVHNFVKEGYIRNTQNVQDGLSSTNDNKLPQIDKQKHPSDVSNEWVNTFGTLAEETGTSTESYMTNNTFQTDYVVDDDDDDDEEQKIHRPLAAFRKHTPAHYGRQIERLAKEGKVIEAIEVLETRMLKDDRVKPNAYVYTVVIGSLGRVGYTKKAFQLYNQMKKMEIAPAPATFTALFNACSNSPWRTTDGLQRATRLRQALLQAEYVPREQTYNAMIKAFGVCGDMLTAFAIADEMQTRYTLKQTTYAMLMMGCISDREAGLKHLIEVWRRMRKRRVTPGTHHYNLLLRAIRDCGVGDTQYANTLLKEPTLETQGEAPSSPQETFDQHHSGVSGDYTNKDVNTTVAYSPSATVSPSLEPAYLTPTHGPAPVPLPTISNTFIPNILNPRGLSQQDGVQLSNLDTPAQRLLLVGGLPGLLGHMTADRAPPDLKTFGLLLELIPGHAAAERDVLAALASHGLRPTVDITNLVIRKRTRRHDKEGVKEVLQLMAKFDLSPNIMTFGCLATGCTSQREGLQLLTDMQNANFHPSIVIYRSLLINSKMNFFYKIEVLKSMKDNQVMPDKDFLVKIEQDVQIARKTVLDKEHGKVVDDYFHSTEFTEGFRKFRLYFKQWSMDMKVECSVHPWDQYHKQTEGR